MDKIAETLGKKLIKQKKIVDEVVIESYDPSDVAPPFKSMVWRGFNIYYDDIEHVYFTEKKGIRFPLLSTTTIWGLFENEFDEKGMSEYKAQDDTYECNCLNKKDWDTLDFKKRAARIRKAWKQNNKEATDYGSAAHECMEMMAKHPEMTDNEILVEVKYRYPRKAMRDVIPTFLKNFRPILEKYIRSGYRVVAEPLLVLLEYGIAGQADLVLIHDENKDIVLLDYKTNKKNPADDKGYGFMLEPFHSFPDNSLTHYSFQQATYALMLMSMFPGYKIKSMNLLWLNPQTGEVNPVPIPRYWLNTVDKHLKLFKDAGSISGAYDMFKKKFKITA